MVVHITPDLTVYMNLNVILTGKTRVVIAVGMENVETQQIIALVRIVQTLHVCTKSGKNLMVHKSGDTMEGVVFISHYLTVHLLNVILTGNILVVKAEGTENVVRQHNIVRVSTVQTLHVLINSGQSQKAHRSGDMTGTVVKCIPYLTVHLLNVILTEVYRVVMKMASVVMTIHFIVYALNVLITELLPK